MSALSIRTMTPADLAIAIEWAAAEGWNPGLDDAPAFLAVDPSGFFIGEVDGEPAGVVSAVRYGETFGFLGFFIVQPAVRGRGYGRALFERALTYLSGRTIGLDGVTAQQANYARSGFTFIRRNVRYGGVANAREVADTHIVELRDGRPAGLAGAVIAYDRGIFLAPRDAFLRAWLRPPGRRTVVYIAENAVLGYGCIRTCREGYKVGPLFADSADIAERLFGALTGRLMGALVFLDLPETNVAARELAERHGMTPAFETARMYRGPAPSEPVETIYGITTFELG